MNHLRLSLILSFFLGSVSSVLKIGEMKAILEIEDDFARLGSQKGVD
jgi:hypothetical protein